MFKAVRGAARESWLRLKGGEAKPSAACFAVSLSDYYEAHGYLPPVIGECVKRLMEEDALCMEGVFRVPGSGLQLRLLRASFDDGEMPDLQQQDVFNCSSLLSLYLRELPECLLPTTTLDSLMESFSGGGDTSLVDQSQIAMAQIAIARMPRSNQLAANLVFRLAHQLTLRADQNKMSASNLAICLCPDLVFPPKGDEEASETDVFAALQASSKYGNVIAHLITHYERAFELVEKGRQRAIQEAREASLDDVLGGAAGSSGGNFVSTYVQKVENEQDGKAWEEETTHRPGRFQASKARPPMPTFGCDDCGRRGDDLSCVDGKMMCPSCSTAPSTAVSADQINEQLDEGISEEYVGKPGGQRKAKAKKDPNETVKCHSCRTRLKSSVKFCVSCGSPQKGTTAATAKKQADSNGVALHGLLVSSDEEEDEDSDPMTASAILMLCESSEDEAGTRQQHSDENADPLTPRRILSMCESSDEDDDDGRENPLSNSSRITIGSRSSPSSPRPPTTRSPRSPRGRK